MTDTPAKPFTVGMLFFPGFTQIDVCAPANILAATPGVEVKYVWKEAGPIRSDSGLVLHADTSFASCGQLDVICVGGGVGLVDLLDDAETLDFLRTQARGAKYVTSVCMGSLVLGAAGLLQGRRSACYWMFLDLIAECGGVPDPGRVVSDGKLLTGGGVTAGVDFALALIGKEFGDATGAAMTLAFEYAPQPPYPTGRPDLAGPELTATVAATAGQEAWKMAYRARLAKLRAA